MISNIWFKDPTTCQPSNLFTPVLPLHQFPHLRSLILLSTVSSLFISPQVFTSQPAKISWPSVQNLPCKHPQLPYTGFSPLNSPGENPTVVKSSHLFHACNTTEENYPAPLDGSLQIYGHKFHMDIWTAGQSNYSFLENPFPLSTMQQFSHFLLSLHIFNTPSSFTLSLTSDYPL